MPEPAEIWRRYRAVTEARPEDLARHLSALDAPSRRHTGRVVALVAASIAAIGLLVPLWPAPEVHGPIASGTSEPVPGLRLDAEGTGRLDERMIHWELGRLEIEADPGVRVVTAEAEVRVTGRAVIERDALGTAVEGAAPTCIAGTGEDGRCLPTTPSGLLGRARAQLRAGLPIATLLSTLEHAERAADDDTVRDEVRAVRVDVLLAAGDTTQARAAAEAYLATGAPHRRPEVLRVAASLAAAAGDCPTASRHAGELGETIECE